MEATTLKPYKTAHFALLLMSLIPVVCSQTMTTGEVTGTVIDSTGGVVIGATVVLKSADTGESRTVQSNNSGVYRFTFLKPGRYQVSSSSTGLRSDTGSLLVAVG